MVLDVVLFWLSLVAGCVARVAKVSILSENFVQRSSLAGEANSPKFCTLVDGYEY